MNTYLNNADSGYIESLYQKFLENPENVDFGWRKFFEGYDLGLTKSGNFETSDNILKEINVLNLIKSYRTRGHLFTHTNPVRARRKYFPDLGIDNFNLSSEDMDKVFNAGIEVGLGPTILRNIIQLLEETYLGSIGAEYMYIRIPERVNWLQKKMEERRNRPNFEIAEKRRLLYKLNQAVVFENFLHTKFVGQKRFSLEGAESLISALDRVISDGAELGIQEFVIGMAHRGRLNVLANILGKTYKDIFSEFEGEGYRDALFEGDVKYHLGYNSEMQVEAGYKIKLTLSPNPSHLEAVNPVVEGISRSKIEENYKGDTTKLAPILIHGDASIAGQGVVYEVQQMSNLKAYHTGGTVHIVINNQIGFTTNYVDARSSTYCTDIAKITLCPVFHVNGDDVESVAYAVRLAMEYRQKFHSDVYVDLLCYRKYGHNEGDEPRFTQPLLYKIIEKHPNPREIYIEKLLKQDELEIALANEMESEFKGLLQARLNDAKESDPPRITNFLADAWGYYKIPQRNDFELPSPDTSILHEKVTEYSNKINYFPEHFNPIQKIRKLFAERVKMVSNGKVDWAMGELMAYASLLDEGFNIRITGQDSERGTFSHRHAVIKQEDSDAVFCPLSDSEFDGKFSIYNSFLSEYAALGFEYGYALNSPDTLTIWEAQFGDFHNGAQIIIDQFIASAGAKWRTHNGLVMFLPHGYEGQGPEHSSARIERFLQLASNYNMQICYPSNPASLFHLLRRQMYRPFRIPLVIFTPKSLLRLPACVSSPEDFSAGCFRDLIDDVSAMPEHTRKVLLCSGKIYYELFQYKKEKNVDDIAIVRLEQLYPMPVRALNDVYNKYYKAKFYWVQEEPKNQGGFLYMLRYEGNMHIERISRPSSASPATGYPKIHQQEQNEIIEKAFS